MEDYKKKYEEALKTAKVLMDNSDDKISKKKIEEIFPELRESEDERIREKVIEVLKFNIDGAESQMQASRGVDRTFEVYACNKVISWLEKQGKVKHTCRNCQTFQNLQQNCPYSPIYQYTDLKESHNHLDDETHCKFWVEKQGEQKHTCQLDNSHARVIFPFKAKVKSTGKIVTIHDGQLSFDGKEWIKYQSDFEDGYKIYEPNDLELVCKIEQKPAWSEEDNKMWSQVINEIEAIKSNSSTIFEKNITQEKIDWLKSLKERMKGE